MFELQMYAQNESESQENDQNQKSTGKYVLIKHLQLFISICQYIIL